MTRVFKPYDAGEERRFLDTHCSLCTASIDRVCPILTAARRNDPFDDLYPSEWILDDGSAPTCTAFAPRAGVVVDQPAEPVHAAAAAPIAAAAPAPAACDTGLDVASIAVTSIGRGVIDALKLRRGKRAWSVPFADVAELFADDGSAAVLRDALKVPEPAKARVHHGAAHVTITARSARDGASVSSSVRLKFAGRRA